MTRWALIMYQGPGETKGSPTWCRVVAAGPTIMSLSLPGGRLYTSLRCGEELDIVEVED